MTKVIANSGWLFLDRGIRVCVGVFVGAWVARYLGPGQFGELSYVLALLSFFVVISQLGLDGPAVRDISVNGARASDILGSVLCLRIATALVCWLMAIVTVAILRPGDVDAMVLTAIVGASVVFQASDTIDLWFQSQSQNRRTVVAKSVAYLAINAVRVLLIVLRAPLIAFAAASLLEFVLAAFAMVHLYRKFPTATRWSLRKDVVRSLLGECWPYLLASVAVIVYMRIDQLMVRAYAGSQALGIYSASISLSAALQILPMAVSITTAPQMARLRSSNPARYEAALSDLFTLMWWTVLPLACLLSVFSKSLVGLLFGPAYGASAPLFAVHVFCNLPLALGVVQSTWIVNERRGAIAIYRTIAGALTNVVLNYLLIPIYGAMGAAIAAVFAQVVAAVVANAFLAPRILRMQLAAIVPRFLRTMP